MGPRALVQYYLVPPRSPKLSEHLLMCPESSCGKFSSDWAVAVLGGCQHDVLVVLRVHSHLPLPLPAQKDDCWDISAFKRVQESSLCHTAPRAASTHRGLMRSVGSVRSPGSYGWWQSLGSLSLGLHLCIVSPVDSHSTLRGGRLLPSLNRKGNRSAERAPRATSCRKA